MIYYDLWFMLHTWKKDFTAREFKETFPSPSPDKVLHDMVKKGLLKKAGRGEYRVNSPAEYVKKKFGITEAYELVRCVGLEYAFTGTDAVFFWTKGGYNADRFLAFYPIHLKVENKDLVEWQAFFRSRGKKYHINGEVVRETFYGCFYELYPESKFSSTEIKGYKVIPLDETIEFCRKNIFTYEPALEMLDEMYDLGLGVKYREEKSI